MRPKNVWGTIHHAASLQMERQILDGLHCPMAKLPTDIPFDDPAIGPRIFARGQLGDYEPLEGGFSDESLEAKTRRRLEHDSYRWEDDVEGNRVVPNHAYIVDKFEVPVDPDTDYTERQNFHADTQP